MAMEMRNSIAQSVSWRSMLGSVQRRSVRALSHTRRNSDASTIPHARGVPVISYLNGERSQAEIIVHEESPLAQPVTPPGVDIYKTASGLKIEQAKKLTPTMSRFTLFGKIAVITGVARSAGRGLGFNMAQALAEVGAKGIAIMDVQQDLGDEAARQLSEQTGVDARFYRVDVRDANAVSEAVQDIIDHYGQIDVLISSAGIADSNIKAETYPIEKFRRLIDINVTGTFLVAQACARHMIERNTPGSMIFIASMSGSIVNFPQEQCCYNSSKAAVIQLAKSLAAEWAKYGIRVNVISPGYMDTALNRVPELDAQKQLWIDLTPQRRLGKVDELNNLAVYLASDASTFMTGGNCIIDGGYTLW